MALGTTFRQPYFTGTSRSEQVPGRFDVSINGRPYMIDRAAGAEAFNRRPIPVLRQQADNSESFGEQTLSPEDAVRRSQESWDHGAGQDNLDRPESDTRRFRSSKGVDVWTRWALSLLPDTSSQRASAATNLLIEPSGNVLYAVDGASLIWATAPPTWTTVTGTPATAASALTSDGYNVWTAHGPDGVFVTVRGTAGTASYNTLVARVLRYVRGRLMAANAGSIYNITAGGTPPAALFTHPNTDFAWVGFAEGRNVIYAAGFSGDKSLIYRITIRQDGSGLDVPVIAGALPDGEVVRSIDAYLGFVLLGTDKGVRFCSSESDGSLVVGSLIRTPQPVRCFEGQDRFVWYGWSNHDGTSTGLGRLDLQTFTAPLTPAYASDLMVPGQGAVTSVATFGDRRYLAVSGLGIYRESVNRVAVGTLDAGRLTYGVSDSKIAFFLDVRTRDGLGGHKAHLAVDGGVFVQIGTRTGRAEDEPFQAGQVAGESFEVRLELNRDADVTKGPTLTRYTLRAYPRPRRGQLFQVPLLLTERVLVRGDQEHHQNPQAELDAFMRLQDSRQLVIYQVGMESHTVLVDDSTFIYGTPTGDGRAWNGTLVVRLKALAS